jgi:hypothetical protein
MNKIAFLILTSFYCLITCGQNSKTDFGIELTPTITSLVVKHFSDDYDPRLSFSTGINVERFINPQFSLKSGLNFERKGSKEHVLLTDDFGKLIGNREIKENSDYLILPILISTYTNGKIKFYVNAGPFLGFLIKNKTIFSAVGDLPKQTITSNANMKRIDLGLSFGVGLRIPLSNVFLFDLGIINNKGLLNTNKIESIKTNSYGFQLGIKYYL